MEEGGWLVRSHQWGVADGVAAGLGEMRGERVEREREREKGKMRKRERE